MTGVETQPRFTLNLPNLLSLVRVPLGIAFWGASSDLVLGFSIIALAAISDLLDGWVARIQGVDGRIGAWLDPLCDKIFVVSVLIAAFVWREPPLSLILLIGAREVLQLPLILAYRFTPAHRRYPVDFKAGWPGKLTTVLQFVTVVLLLVEHSALWIAALACAVSGVGAVTWYLHRALASRQALEP